MERYKQGIVATVIRPLVDVKTTTIVIDDDEIQNYGGRNDAHVQQHTKDQIETGCGVYCRTHYRRYDLGRSR